MTALALECIDYSWRKIHEMAGDSVDRCLSPSGCNVSCLPSFLTYFRSAPALWYSYLYVFCTCPLLPNHIYLYIKKINLVI